MIGAWIKGIVGWFSGLTETKRLKASNAAREQQLMAAAAAPDAPAELVEQATLYLAGKPATKKLKEKVNGSQ